MHLINRNDAVNTTASSVLSALQEIAEGISIDAPNFCIRHPRYQPWELPADTAGRLQQLPSSIREKYLSLQLRSFLYGLYYNNSLTKMLALDGEETSGYQDLENNTFLGIDVAFYEQLHSSNAGKGYFDPGWQIFRQEHDGTVAVVKDGLTLHVDPELHLLPGDRSAAIGAEVAVKMPKNLLQNGFYMAIGNLGREYSPGKLARVYFNVEPNGAIALMANLTACFNALPIPFSFKALYNPGDYGRYDAGVLYFSNHHYETVRLVLQQVYADCQQYFQPQIPLFAKQLAPGLGLAEEPDRKFTSQESFGLNRCQIVANGLLAACGQGDESAEGRMQAIWQQFWRLGIDWQRPYLNAGAEDIYPPL